MSETNPSVPTENALTSIDVVTPPLVPEPVTPITPVETPASYNPDHPIAFNTMTREVVSISDATKPVESNPLAQVEMKPVSDPLPVTPLPKVEISVPDPVQEIDLAALRQRAAEAQAVTAPMKVEAAPQLPPQPQPEPNGLMRFFNRLRGK